MIDAIYVSTLVMGQLAATDFYQSASSQRLFYLWFFIALNFALGFFFSFESPLENSR